MKSRPTHYRADGVLSPNGKRFIRLEIGDTKAYVPQLMLATDEQEAKIMLASQGALVGPYWNDFRREATFIKSFESEAICERVGWNADVFALPNRELVVPEDVIVPVCVFETDNDEFTSAGSLHGWKTLIASRLTGQSLLMTMTMAVLAGPLVSLIQRRENIGVALLGGPGCGKSFLLDVVRSLFGYPRAGSFNVTIDGLENEMSSHSDLCLILDELNLFDGDAPAARRGTRQKAAAFRLSDGTIKKRWMTPGQKERYHYTWLTATNEQISSLMTAESEGVVRATSDRLLTLRIEPDRPHKTFDFIPDEYGGGGAFARALKAAAIENHGYAMPAYLKGLVDDLARDRVGTIARIRSNVDLWCINMGINDDDGSEARVGEAFGLFYAAGEEAKRHKVLPAEWRCGSAVERAYCNFYVGPKPPATIDDVVRAHLQQDSVYDIDTHGLRRMSDDLLSRVPALLKTNRRGQLEALILPPRAAVDLPDLRARLAASKAGLKLNCEAGRYDNKRKIRRDHGLERVVVVTLPRGFLKAA